MKNEIELRERYYEFELAKNPIAREICDWWLAEMKAREEKLREEIEKLEASTGLEFLGSFKGVNTAEMGFRDCKNRILALIGSK